MAKSHNFTLTEEPSVIRTRISRATRAGAIVCAGVAVAALAASPAAQAAPSFTPGSAGVGDPYFPR